MTVMTLQQADAPARANSQDIPQLARKILAIRGNEQRRLKRISKYMRGHHDSVYVPHGAREEYRWLLKRSIVNFLPLVVSTISQNLHVDGYRPSAAANVVDDVTVAVEAAHAALAGGDAEGATAILARAKAAQAQAQSQPDDGPWRIWQANRMGSRQHGLHRSVVKYGISYTVVLPGEPLPVIRPVSPRRLTALYADDVDDEWPIYAVEETVVNAPGGARRIVRLYDDANVYTLTGKANSPELFWPNPDDPVLMQGTQTVAEHDLGVCPVIRFLHEVDLDGEMDVSGVVEPLITLQDQINTTTFNGLMSQQYAAFRQRWVTGMVVTDEDGNPREPFRAGVDRLFTAEDADTKFGEFGQTDLSGFLKSAEASISHMSTICQLPPYYLLGQTVNLSADALTASRDALDRQVEELQAVLTEPYKQTLQLASQAAGDAAGFSDAAAVIVWRDTGGRAFAGTVDALGKLAQMLGVPATELWQRVPGTTADDIARWKAAANSQGALAELDKIVDTMFTKGTQDTGPDAADPFQGPAMQRAKGV